MHALDPVKFRDPWRTAKGEARAVVALNRLSTLWFNTGSLCNLGCQGCYMDSSPDNDALAYITQAEVETFLDEARALSWPIAEAGFTGGEPFMNPEMVPILEAALDRGLRALVLSNATRPLHRAAPALSALAARHGERLLVRVSIDDYREANHQALRGAKNWARMLDGVRLLIAGGISIAIAGRTCWGEDEDTARRGYTDLFVRHQIPLDARDPAQLVLFPEMDAARDVPEITTACWDILGVRPEAMMCASARMVVRRKGSAAPMVVPCTLLPYDPNFELGATLAEADRPVPLNHPHCARFCVLGGASCGAG